MDCSGKNTIISIEEPFQFHVPGVDVPMIGVMDVVEEGEDKEILITEYKTAAKSYTKQQVDKMLQLTVYYMAAQKNGFHDRNIELKVDALVKTKVPRLESIATTRNELDCRRTTKLIQEVWRGIRSGVFVPNDSSWQCVRCEYANACRERTNEEVAYAA